jgi:ribulose-phosphate 3-epimerase
MVAINPATPVSVLECVLGEIDGVLIMTVNPGFAGQKLVKSTLPKITRLREQLDALGYTNVEIEVDGNVSFENAKLMTEAGADIFVAGTSSVFKKEFSLSEGIARLREVIG